MTASPSGLATALADRYRIERELGQGGMATVYLAHDVRHDRKVALKVMRPELAALIGAERFLAEIRTTANLQHPHILPLFDSGQVATTSEAGDPTRTVFYVMPFVEGESLRDRLAREKQLPVRDAVRIAAEVAGALDYAHRRGVIHRDIKPENILLHDGRALVADFGIALAASRSEGGARMTETGMSLGTPHYMAPEQAMGERDLSPGADIYALGCVLYEMLTAEPPFTGATAQAVIARVMTEEPRPLALQRRTVPPHVEAAVLTALAKLPADRFRTAAEFSEALADDSRRPALLPQPGHAPARQSPLLRALPWAVAAIGLAAGALGLARRKAPEPAPIRFAFPLATGDAEFQTRDVTLSPDGRVIVYADLVRGVPRLFRRVLDSLEARPVAGTEGGFQPVISPDGRSVAFATVDGRIKRVPLEGGASLSLASTTSPAGIGWSARHGLVLGMPSFSRTIRGLSLVGVEGDTGLKVITTPGDRGMHHDPLVLPDGETALYVDFTAGKPSALGVASLARGTAERIDLPLFGIAGLVDGVLVYVGLDNALMAVRFDVRRRRVLGQPIRITDFAGELQDAVLSPGGTLAALVAPGQFEVVLVDERGEAVPILSDTVGSLTPRFSPDGRRIALGGNIRGSFSGWIFDLDTRTLSRLRGGVGARGWSEWTSDGTRLLGTRYGRPFVLGEPADGSDTLTVVAGFPSLSITGGSLSPDGRHLALGTGVGPGEYNIVVARLDGDTTVTPFATSNANELAPRFSPDGRWLAYASDESGRYEVYVRSFPGPGARVQVSDGGGGQPVWSGDSRRLFYRVDRAVMAAELVVGPEGGTLRVTSRRRLFEGDFHRSATSSHRTTYDVAPDGSRFVMARVIGRASPQIVVWTNWLPEIRARLARAR